MKRAICLFAAMACCSAAVCCSGAVAAGEPEPAAALGEIGERLGGMAAWIVANSAYPNAPDQGPEIVFLSDAELQELATGTSASVQTSKSVGGAYGALYSQGVVYLREDFVPGRDDQILLHELVHHFQWANGLAGLCRGRREAEAYELQRRYAEARGEEPRVPGALALIVVTSCRASRLK